MEDNKKGIYKTLETEVIDSETGEVLQYKSETEKVYFDKEPDYVKLYLKDIVRLKELPPTSERLLMVIVKHMGYNNLFQAYKPLKLVICQQLGMSINTLNNQISNLRKAGILIPMDKYGRGLYLVDPNLFARGNWKDIKNLRLVIDYNPDGTKTLSSNAPEKLKQLAFNFDE